MRATACALLFLFGCETEEVVVDAGAGADATVLPDASVEDGGVLPEDSGVRALFAKEPFLEADPGLLVFVRFGGAQPALMRYDTGSPSTYLDRDFAVREGINDGPTDALIGAATFTARPLTLIDWYEADFTYPGIPAPIAGLIGNDFFDGFAVGVDHRDQLLWITESPLETDALDRPEGTRSPPAIVPFTIEQGYLLVRCGFDTNDDHDCLFDFGALESFAFERVWTPLDHPDLHQVPLFTVDNQGHPLRGYFQRANVVHAGELSVPGDYVSVFREFALLDQVGAAIGHTLGGLVGLQTTVGHYSVVDYANHRLAFYPYDPIFEHESPFVGFGFVVGTSTEAASLAVRAVVPLSEAEFAGVQDGDLLREIDGMPAGSVQLTYTIASIIKGTPGERRNFRFQRGAMLIEVDLGAEDLLPPIL